MYKFKKSKKMELVVYLHDREKKLLELRYLAAQIKQSSYGNPIEWQREIRQDRVLPFREN